MIKLHNSKVLSKTTYNNNDKCNSRSKPNCPLNEECLSQCLVYKATSATSNNSFVYYGTSEGDFKTWCNNRAESFRHCQYVNKTDLSKYVWSLKENDLDNSLS